MVCEDFGGCVSRRQNESLVTSHGDDKAGCILMRRVAAPAAFSSPCAWSAPRKASANSGQHIHYLHIHSRKGKLCVRRHVDVVISGSTINVDAAEHTATTSPLVLTNSMSNNSSPTGNSPVIAGDKSSHNT
mgnify:CR=1 FL=1